MFEEQDVQQQFRMEMDTEKLISEVEMRPSCDEYKNRFENQGVEWHLWKYDFALCGMDSETSNPLSPSSYYSSSTFV